MADQNPAVTEFRRKLANTLCTLGEHLAGTQKLSDAETEFREALALYQQLADANPKVPDFRNSVALCHIGISGVVLRLGRPAEARDGYERAVAISEPMARENPMVAVYRRSLALGQTGRRWPVWPRATPPARPPTPAVAGDLGRSAGAVERGVVLDRLLSRRAGGPGRT